MLSSNYGWVWLLLFPRSQKKIKFRKQDPKSDQNAHNFLFLSGLLFRVWNRTIIMLARTTRDCPGRIKYRLSKKPASSTSRTGMCAPRVMRHRCTPRHISLTKGRPLWRGHAHARPRRTPAKSCGGGLAGCRCNINKTTVCFVDYCSMLTRVLCVLFFFAADATGKRKK